VVEQLAFNQLVDGSNPSRPTISVSSVFHITPALTGFLLPAVSDRATLLYTSQSPSAEAGHTCKISCFANRHALQAITPSDALIAVKALP